MYIFATVKRKKTKRDDKFTKYFKHYYSNSTTTSGRK